MIEFIKHWVINIVALVLFIVIIEMLLPSGKMKKFINLVTGTILVIAIITPLVEFLGKGFDLEAFQTTNSNYLDRLQVEKDSKLLEDVQMKQTVEVYRRKIIDQLEQSSLEIGGVKEARADIIFNEDYKSKDFGEIKRVYLEVVPDDNTGNGKGNSKAADDAEDADVKNDVSGVNIEEVQDVETIRIGKKEQKETLVEDCDPELKEKLANKINQIFGIKSEDIIISKMVG